jgi:hypothetical protein
VALTNRARREELAVTGDTESYRERAKHQQAEARQDQQDQSVEHMRQLGQLSDAELMAAAPGFTAAPNHQMEMQRRLRVAVEALTAETIKSRESSERLGRQLDASIASLTGEIVTFRESSDAAARKVATLTNWLIAFTAGLLVLTGVLVALTVVLIVTN